MELTNEFIVERPIDETWKIINDLEFIAPCMPGAQLTEIEGEEYRGLVKIKVGPITAKYKGKASFVSQDEEAKVSKLSAEGRDPRNGNANAIITATMTEATEGTKVVIHTDLALVGKIASFGRGAIEDVSKKLMTMFSDNLRDKLAETDSSGTPPEAPTTVGTADTAKNEDSVRKIQSEEPDAVDLFAVTGDSMIKRLAPVLGGVVLLLILRMLLKGRRSD